MYSGFRDLTGVMKGSSDKTYEDFIGNTGGGSIKVPMSWENGGGIVSVSEETD